MKVIQIKAINSYGNTLYYPMCEQGKRFARLTNTKTLTKAHLSVIKDLGYTIGLETPTLRESLDIFS